VGDGGTATSLVGATYLRGLCGDRRCDRGAVTGTIGLYQKAIGQARDAAAANVDARYAQELISIFAQQRIVMFRYIATGSPAVLSSVDALDAQFHQVSAAVTPETPARAQALASADAAQARYYSGSRCSWSGCCVVLICVRWS
jgi:hypothetical protein